MRTELSHLSNVLKEHMITASCFPLNDLLGRFVALFRERLEDNDSRHALVCRDDFISIILDVIGTSMDAFAEQLFSALIDIVLLKSSSKDASEMTEHHELVDIQLFVLLMLLTLESQPNQNRELLFYGLIGDLEKDDGSYFQLERVLTHLIYYLNDWTLVQAKSKARSIVILLQETQLANIKKNELQNKKEKDKKRVKKLWDTHENIELDRNIILKQILIQSPYIPSQFKRLFIDVIHTNTASSNFDSSHFTNNDIPSKQKYDYHPKTRPPPVHKLENYSITPLSGKHRKRQRRYAKLDTFAMNTIEEDELNIDTVARRLCSLARNDEEKYRVFFKWVSYHITYDPSSSDSVPQDAESVFSNRRANSEGFANLFSALCTAQFLTSEVISGSTNDQSLGHSPDEQHFWNSVVLDKSTYFVDCALGSGHFDGEQHVKQLRNYYFLVPPDSFIDNHYPSDPSKQHLKVVITPEVYAQRNILLYRGSEFGLTMSGFSTTGTRIDLKNTNTVRMKFVGDDVQYKVLLRDIETGEEVGVGQTELVNEKKRKHKLRARIPEPLPKEYLLELRARHKIPEPEEEEEEEEEDEDDENENKKPKEKAPEPEFELLIQWTVSKFIEPKAETKEEDGEGEENEGEENGEGEEEEEEEDDE